MKEYPLPSPYAPDVWERVSAAGLPAVIYGTGNGADKVMDELGRRKIPVAAVFASDGFVRERTFRGYRVMSYAEVCRELSDFTVLLAFGTSRPDVLENIGKISREHTLLCPDVPAFGEAVFDGAYYRENYGAFCRLYDSLADGESRRVLSLILEYKLTGSITPLAASASGGLPFGFFDCGEYETYIDLGAYTGDTVRDAVKYMPRLRRVIALEPEPHAYKKLSALAEATASPRIETYNAAAWKCGAELKFVTRSGRGSSSAASMHAGTKTRTVHALAVDGIADERVDIIKFDVEGAEEEAILGAAETIRRDRPDMIVSVYHRTGDLLSLPALVRNLVPEYRLYLRREPGVPAWGIDLFATVKNRPE